MELKMTKIRTGMAVLAATLLMATAVPVFADSQDGHYSGSGYTYRHDGDYRGADNADDHYGLDRNDRGQGTYDGGWYAFGGDAGQRMEHIKNWVRYMARSGELNHWQAHRAFDMLWNIRQEASYCQHGGHGAPWECAQLNYRIDRLVAFLRDARNDGDGNDHYRGRYDRDGAAGSYNGYY
jgi:hypothetical protein